MVYPFGEFSHGLVVSYTDWRKTAASKTGQGLIVDFSKETKSDHKTASFTLPSQQLVYNWGFGSLEIKEMRRLLKKYAGQIEQEATNRKKRQLH